ncbi:MAG: PEPxxWA-CTERM sorting domain-containing protein [Proteobacteria bacterium]|nr:PEPxxWA-CTERM sorting domain-containing protein [Pseudomonadota bacterium]
MAQISAGSLTVGGHNNIEEAEIPFGTNASSHFEDFSYRPVTFEAGELYRVRAKHDAGSVGQVAWYYSDEAAADGQSVRTNTGHAAVDLDFQPAFALTDGGDLVFADAGGGQPGGGPVGGVPEPATWALMIAGVSSVGALLRRRRSLAAPA